MRRPKPFTSNREAAFGLFEQSILMETTSATMSQIGQMRTFNPGTAMTTKYVLVSSGFESTAEVPKDTHLHYRCRACGSIVPSIPDENIGCECGNVFIDRDYWRLVVETFADFEVVKLG